MALASGMRAKICGLNSRKDLNEQEVVLEKYVGVKGRWACRTVGVLTEGILVRPDNLVRSPSMLAELPDDELLLVLEQVPIKDLAEHVSVASHKLRAAMQRTWSGPAWCKVRRFFSRTMARAGKQELIRAAVIERDDADDCKDPAAPRDDAGDTLAQDRTTVLVGLELCVRLGKIDG